MDESLYRRLDSVYRRLFAERAAIRRDLEEALAGTHVRVEAGRVDTSDVRLVSGDRVLEIDVEADRWPGLSFEGLRRDPDRASYERFTSAFVTDSRHEAVTRALEHFGLGPGTSEDPNPG